VPLTGTEKKLADAMYAAAKGADGNPEKAWEAVAKALVPHLTENTVVTGTTPNGGPVQQGKIV